MKVKEKYEELKKQHQEEIVLLKVGSFYVTFGFDAITMNYLFSYQINNEKLGFPVAALTKVTKNLRDKNISFYIVENEEITIVYQDKEYVLKIADIASAHTVYDFKDTLKGNKDVNMNKLNKFNKKG